MKLVTGEKVWTRTLLQDFEGSEGYFGAGSTPLVMSEKLLVNVGGKGAGIVALDPKSGKTVWKGTDEQASYSSPMAAQLLGKPVAVFITRLNLVVIEPMTGKVLFTKPFGARGPTVNGANPLVLGDHIFLSASYGVGASWCHVTATGLNAVWENDDTLSSQYPTAVHNQGILFGIHGRQDIGLAALRAIDPKQGKVLWSQEQFGMACPILADGKILLPKTSGELVLAEANPQRFAELASATLFNSTVQALPALSHGLLYLRDTQTLKCLEVGKR